MTRPEPAVPLDGTCAECGNRRGVGAKNRAARAAAVLDPFCSTECARRYFGVVFVSIAQPTPRGYVSRLDGGR